ncbi:AAA family ATPase [Candidatus Fermentibacteria bacterium]|nr:AAA family ATPase [Candidatus Fermentibacteria bacterium]
MTRILAVANQKGGVGKTTTVINLGASLAVNDLDVLVLDMDPQTNATSGLGLEDTERGGMMDLLTGEATVGKLVVETEVEGLWAIPGSRGLAGLEIELASESGRESFLAHALRESESLNGYDYVLVDCPPSLGLLTVNSLVAATGVLLPLQSEYYALEGLSHLMDTIGEVRRLWNSDLRIEGVFLTMYDGRLRLAREVADNVASHLGESLMETKIPRNVRLSEAPSYGKPAMLYDAYCAGSKSYLRLAGEVMSR